MLFKQIQNKHLIDYENAIKAAVTDIRYFSRSMLSRSLVDKKIVVWYNK